jgi:hypothetical protein
MEATTAYRWTRWTWRQVAAVFAVLTLTVGAVYDAAVALDWIPLGDLPGEDAPGAGAVYLIAWLGWLSGLIVSFATIRRPEKLGLATRHLLPLVPAAWLVAGYYSYDPYCAPSRCRVSDYSGVSPWVIFACLLAAPITSAFAAVAPRAAMVFTAVCFVAFPVVAFVVGPWH